jgi:hypothetical protein
LFVDQAAGSISGIAQGLHHGVQDSFLEPLAIRGPDELQVLPDLIIT